MLRLHSQEIDFGFVAWGVHSLAAEPQFEENSCRGPERDIQIQKSSPLGTTNYLYDGDNLIGEVDSSGNVLARYTQTQNLDELLSELRSGTTSYYQRDALSSITSLSSGTGALANTYSYDSFGRLTTSTGTLTNPFRYTGREYDQETGLSYYRARYLDSSTGRFISQDPIGYNGGMNVYRYVRNNPVLFADPLGLCDVTRIKLWSTDEVTITGPRSPWELNVSHQENADGILPINNLWCHWTREYNTSIHTTTTYLVYEICDGTHACQYYAKERIYFEKEQSWRTGTTTKTFDYGMFTLTGFDEGQDFLQEFYCKQHAPSD